MISFEEAMQSLKGGNVFVVYYDRESNQYLAGMIRYDGMIPRDVVEVELGSSMDLLPDICERVKNGEYCHVCYSNDSETYRAAMMKVKKKADYGSSDDYTIVDNLLIENSDYYRALIDLENQMEKEIPEKKISKKNRLSYASL